MDAQRAAWLRKYATQAAPWRGPVHAAPLLADLRGRVVELGAAGGKVGALLPHALALDWVRVEGRPAVLADVRALPFRGGSLDALVALHVLDHLADDAALHEWARVLRPGGALVLEVFARGDARDPGPAAGHAATREGILTRYRDERALEDALREAGFAGALAAEERALRWGTRRVLRGRFMRAARDARP